MFDDHKLFSQAKVASFAGIVVGAGSCDDRRFNIKVNCVVLEMPDVFREFSTARVFPVFECCLVLCVSLFKRSFSQADVVLCGSDVICRRRYLGVINKAGG